MELCSPPPVNAGTHRNLFPEIIMAKRGFVQKTQRKIVGVAKDSAARIQQVAIRAATAAAMAAAEAAVTSMMRSMTGGQRGAPARRQKARKTVRNAARKAVKRSPPRRSASRKKRV
jgi:hypothetical protein